MPRESDARRQAQVVVIDHNTRHRLFGPGVDPLGQVILVGNPPCTVIGVAADNKNMFAASKALNVWVPYETAAGRLLGQRHLDNIVRIKDGQPSKVVEERHQSTSSCWGPAYPYQQPDKVIKMVKKPVALALLPSPIGDLAR